MHFKRDTKIKICALANLESKDKVVWQTWREEQNKLYYSKLEFTKYSTKHAWVGFGFG